jgi:hypothetical protein
MKYILTLLILGSFVQIANAQLSFKIEELSLSNYNIELKENIINEDLTSGPYVYFKCIITNNSEDTVILRPSNSITNIVFSYKKKSYKIEVEPLPFVDNEKLQLSPKKLQLWTLEAIYCWELIFLIIRKGIISKRCLLFYQQ